MPRWCAPRCWPRVSTCSCHRCPAPGTVPMTEPARVAARPPLVPALLACGLLLSGVAAAGGVVAVLAGLLAQPLLGVGLSWWRGTRGTAVNPRAALAALPPLLLLWAAGLALAALLMAWPLQALGRQASLGAVLGTSAMAALLVLALWRSWPLWRTLESEGGNLAALWRRLPQQQAVEGWAGLGAAVAIALLLGGWLLLSWPGL